jgi:hypothetical protein
MQTGMRLGKKLKSFFNFIFYAERTSWYKSSNAGVESNIRIIPGPRVSSCSVIDFHYGPTYGRSFELLLYY